MVLLQGSRVVAVFAETNLLTGIAVSFVTAQRCETMLARNHIDDAGLNRANLALAAGREAMLRAGRKRECESVGKTKSQDVQLSGSGLPAKIR